MSILVDENIRLLIQGITGKQGRVHAKRSLDCGVKLVAGVSTSADKNPTVEGVPVYKTVKEAVEKYPEINATMILIPPMGAKSAAFEAIEAGIPLIVIITEFVPVHDALQIMNVAKKRGVQVIGPNTIGVISPGKSKVGIMPEYIYGPGRIGVASRSGTLTHELSSSLTFAGFGQSTCVGIGGDSVIGLTHLDALKKFRDDPDTKAVILIGEIGGSGEEMAAKYIKETKYPKPVFAYIAGASAPEGQQMGHAGAIVMQGMGTAKSKIGALTDAGVFVGKTIGQVIDAIAKYSEEHDGVLKTLTPIKDE